MVATALKFPLLLWTLRKMFFFPSKDSLLLKEILVLTVQMIQRSRPYWIPGSSHNNRINQRSKTTAFNSGSDRVGETTGSGEMGGELERMPCLKNSCPSLEMILVFDRKSCRLKRAQWPPGQELFYKVCDYYFYILETDKVLVVFFQSW